GIPGEAQSVFLNVFEQFARLGAPPDVAVADVLQREAKAFRLGPPRGLAHELVNTRHVLAVRLCTGLEGEGEDAQLVRAQDSCSLERAVEQLPLFVKRALALGRLGRQR